MDGFLVQLGPAERRPVSGVARAVARVFNKRSAPPRAGRGALEGLARRRLGVVRWTPSPEREALARVVARTFTARAAARGCPPGQLKALSRRRLGLVRFSGAD